MPVVSSPLVSTSTYSASLVHQLPVQGRRDGERIVDEGAVEPVIALVELEVEPERVGDEADHRVGGDRPFRFG